MGWVIDSARPQSKTTFYLALIMSIEHMKVTDLKNRETLMVSAWNDTVFIDVHYRCIFISEVNY